MSVFIPNPPSAASLLESMRDVGYSLETTLADLIDNSISIDAGTVETWHLSLSFLSNSQREIILK